MPDRYKVRSRAYVETNLAYFEVKHKTNKKRTIKTRLQTVHLMTNVDRETAVFLHDHYPYEAAGLLPVLWNSFTRITLVSTHRSERLTLDFDLSFQKGQQQIVLPGVAIAEVKREGFSDTRILFSRCGHWEYDRPPSANIAWVSASCTRN